jgi:hypothetical protein
VARYRSSLGEAGAKLRRQRIKPAGALTWLATDLYDPDTGELYEAKASSVRNEIRLAIGQLLDYRRWIEPHPARCTILVPSRPADDLVHLLHDLRIGLVYEAAPGDFQREDPPHD